jgi:hypothetical protein
MNRAVTKIRTPNGLARALAFAAFLPRAALLVLALSAPVFAMSGMSGEQGSIIEHDQKKSNGIGFVLLVSLQR